MRPKKKQKNKNKKKTKKKPVETGWWPSANQVVANWRPRRIAIPPAPTTLSDARGARDARDARGAGHHPPQGRFSGRNRLFVFVSFFFGFLQLIRFVDRFDQSDVAERANGRACRI